MILVPAPRLFVALLVALPCALTPAPAAAQFCAPPRPDCPKPPPPPAPSLSVQDDVAMLGINALLGGVTAGLRGAWAGRDFSDAFLRGALGGGVGYVGKRVTARRFDGAGFVGRQIAGVGHSFVRNAADGVPMLDRFYVPLWLVRLEVRPFADGVETPRARARLDVATTAFMTWAALDDQLSFDPGRTLSAGAVVFRTDDELLDAWLDEGQATGGAVAGVILIADGDYFPRSEVDATFAHERVHTLQVDQIFEYWADPLEESALRLIGGEPLTRWLDLNFTWAALLATHDWIDYYDRPWEQEAERVAY